MYTGADLGGILGVEATPLQRFTMSKLRRKLLEAVVQVQLHFIYMYEQLKAENRLILSKNYALDAAKIEIL